MGLIQDFWKKKKNRQQKDFPEEQWEEVVYERDELQIHEEGERHKYVEECLKQMGDAYREMELLGGEYNLVTTYLTDMEEIEQLPEDARAELTDICSRMVNLGEEKVHFQERKSRMSEEQYKNIERNETEVESGIQKITEAEEYRKLVKQDLRRLDGEKSAYRFRRAELENELMNIRGMSMIILAAIGVCFVMLLILQLGLEMDTRLGYLLMAGIAAVAITVLFLKYTEGEKELKTVVNATNRLVQLHNTVKIRYVNNTNLLDYYCIKFGIKNSAELTKYWNKYQQEKEEKRKYRRTELELDLYQEELIKFLRSVNIKEPARWLRQTAAIVDSREMVEIRHELIMRRQSLRKQMDYNKEVADSARREIMDIATSYPEYAGEITRMIERYEKMY